MKVNHDLVRERLTYPLPRPPTMGAEVGEWEWSFRDRFGNRYGRLFCRRAVSGVAAEGDDWVDVFGRENHCSEYVVGHDFVVVTVAEESVFSLFLVRPMGVPAVFYSSPWQLKVEGLSRDETLLLIQSAVEGDCFRPALVVVDIEGVERARLTGVRDVWGIWHAQWSPDVSSRCVVFSHEADGFLRPALWFPFTNTVEEIAVSLEGEVTAEWNRSGDCLILKRVLNGRSDLHRFTLSTRECECLQPLDGTIFRHVIESDDQVVGTWTSGDGFARNFKEKHRLPLPDFTPSSPLRPWVFRRVQGVPVFIVGDANCRWTVFDGYGGPAYHHFEAYNRKVVTLVDHGYRVVMVNTRGCSGFGRDWRRGSLENLGFTELEDLRLVRAELIREGLVDADRTIISGDSWGGYMALLAMGTQPELWKMAVAGLPVGDFEGAYEQATPLIQAWNRTQFGGPVSTHRDAYRKASPLTYVDAIRNPILMICGLHDLLCPPAQNQTFADAVVARKGICELHLYEGAHGPADLDERIKQCELTLDFLDRHCSAFDSLEEESRRRPLSK